MTNHLHLMIFTTFGGHPSIAFKKAGEDYEQSKSAIGGKTDMRFTDTFWIVKVGRPSHRTA